MGAEKHCTLVLENNRGETFVVDSTAYGLRTDQFPFATEQNLVLSYTDDNQAYYRDSVCIIDAEDPLTISDAGLDLKHHGAVAMLIAQQPQGCLNLPCFVVTTSDISEMKRMQKTKITIKMDTSVSSEKTSSEVESFETTASPPVEKVDSLYDLWIECPSKSKQSLYKVRPSGHLTMKEFPFGKSLSSVFVSSVFDVERAGRSGDIVALCGSIENSVCFFDSTKEKDINKAIALAEGHGAIAIVVRKAVIAPIRGSVHVFLFNESEAWPMMPQNSDSPVVVIKKTSGPSLCEREAPNDQEPSVSTVIRECVRDLISVDRIPRKRKGIPRRNYTRYAMVPVVVQS